MEAELPFIVDRVKRDGMRLLWVAVGHSLVAQTELSKFQAVNDPKRPLETMDRPPRMAVWTQIAEAVKISRDDEVLRVRGRWRTP
jgi:hypothetical protein